MARREAQYVQVTVQPAPRVDGDEPGEVRKMTLNLALEREASLLESLRRQQQRGRHASVTWVEVDKDGNPIDGAPAKRAAKKAAPAAAEPAE
ncbi:MAG TPA: hypothetical protein VIR00_08050 [Micromonosporaceae bacterium]|jgi:hypothetical protein